MTSEIIRLKSLHEIFRLAAIYVTMPDCLNMAEAVARGTSTVIGGDQVTVEHSVLPRLAGFLVAAGRLSSSVRGSRMEIIRGWASTSLLPASEQAAWLQAAAGFFGQLEAAEVILAREAEVILEARPGTTIDDYMRGEPS
jgi:hypothetical protein